MVWQAAERAELVINLYSSYLLKVGPTTTSSAPVHQNKFKAQVPTLIKTLSTMLLYEIWNCQEEEEDGYLQSSSSNICTLLLHPTLCYSTEPVRLEEKGVNTRTDLL